MYYQSESETDSEKEDAEKKEDKDKNAASGTSTKGANTPQGKKAATDAAKKGKSLKRPGSPLGSDSSGTESTRNKKKKKLGPSTSVGGSRSATPLPAGMRGAGSTSDGEATAGEMSDGAGGKVKRRAHLGTSPKGTPTGSRAGSPIPSRPRAGSPSAGAAQETLKPITSQEIVDALPPLPNGISVAKLLKRFENRVDKEGHLTRKEWLNLVKENVVFNQNDKLLRRKA
jgi:transcription initiation factor TFIIF subunit alpha